MISDLLPVLTLVRTLAKHALIGDDTHCKVVNSNAMVLSAHDFWCHVARSARRVFGVLRIPEAGNSEVCNSQETIFVKDEVLRLDVSVKNGILMQVLKAEEHASNKELYINSNHRVSEVSQTFKNADYSHPLCPIHHTRLTGLFFWKASVLADVVAKITATHEIDDQVEILSVFESIVHVHQESTTLRQMGQFIFKMIRVKSFRPKSLWLALNVEWGGFVLCAYLRMIKLTEELFLVHDWVYTTLADDPGLSHLLHCVQLFVFSVFNFPYFTETASANHILPIEVILVRF